MTSTSAGFDPDAVCQHPLDFLFAEWTMEQTPSLTVARFSDSHVQFLQKLHGTRAKRIMWLTNDPEAFGISSKVWLLTGTTYS
jgi:hypothetical protein